MNRTVLGVLVSGRGSNLQAILDAIMAERLKAKIGVVISDNPEALALKRVSGFDIATAVIERRKFPDRSAFEQAIIRELELHHVELVALAGFMRILGGEFIGRFPGRIMNIHPALLPSFPGAHAHQDVLAYGVKISGCTVHFVDEGTDSGPIILQAAVPVLDGDTEEALGARVLEQEHIIYPRAIQLYCEGKLEIHGRHVRILE